jgi:arsenate reductase-like glutaredoxin family protein
LQKGITPRERELFKEPLSADELKEILHGRPVSEVFATRSPKFKELGLNDQALTDDDRLRLMVEYPQLIRRPLVAVGDALVVGFDAKALETIVQ